MNFIHETVHNLICLSMLVNEIELWKKETFNATLSEFKEMYPFWKKIKFTE